MRRSQVANQDPASGRGPARRRRPAWDDGVITHEESADLRIVGDILDISHEFVTPGLAAPVVERDEQTGRQCSRWHWPRVKKSSSRVICLVIGKTSKMTCALSPIVLRTCCGFHRLATISLCHRARNDCYETCMRTHALSSPQPQTLIHVTEVDVRFALIEEVTVARHLSFSDC